MARQAIWEYARRLDLLDTITAKSRLTEPEALALGDSIKRRMAAKYRRDKVPGT